jgi:hypothetical protein
MDSQMVSWWPVHEFVDALVQQHNYEATAGGVGFGVDELVSRSLPAAGTPAWCALADGDPRKLLALAAAGEHWVLRTEIAQEKRAEASHEISAAGGWTALARTQLRRADAQRTGTYIPRERTAS